MKIALLASTGETVALASRLISSGNTVRTAFADESVEHKLRLVLEFL
jgi:hypothetical protein